jgi:YfiH family protein
MEPRVELLRAPGFEFPAGVVHGFTTREGGVSTEARATLNLALRAGETEAGLHENWRRVVGSLDVSLSAENLAILHQVHGVRVVEVQAGGGPLAPVAEADAAICIVPGVVLAVRVADCVPVLLATPRCVAVAHAGWRGVAGDIVAATVAAMLEKTGESPDAVCAAIGPHIGVGAFEVGEEVVDQLAATGISPSDFARYDLGPRPHVVLSALLRAQLGRCGVDRIGVVAGCTVTEPRFFSHRRDGERTGRLAGVIARLR